MHTLHRCLKVMNMQRSQKPRLQVALTEANTLPNPLYAAGSVIQDNQQQQMLCSEQASQPVRHTQQVYWLLAHAVSGITLHEQ